MPPLGPLLVITDATATGGRPLVEVVAAAVDGGARAVLLRDKQLPATERAALAGVLRPLLHAAGGLLLVSSTPWLEADGLHLAAADRMPDGPALPGLVGRSCHSAAELAAAAAEGCDYATLSPIAPTPSKPGYGPALGPAALAGAPLPVYALGGITPALAAACVAAGAAGVAVMGGVMAAPDPAAAVAALLASLAAPEART